MSMAQLLPGPQPRRLPPLSSHPAILFDTVDEAWFWFITAHELKMVGARLRAGEGIVARPCESGDILGIVDRLHRQRLLLRDHLLVLAHYGRRQLAPDSDRPREARDHTLWVEALAALAPVLQAKGILK